VEAAVREDWFNSEGMTANNFGGGDLGRTDPDAFVL
jgi:hypothetical protein